MFMSLYQVKALPLFVIRNYEQWQESKAKQRWTFDF
ncbi:hypothetical protein NIES2107_05650 [Nostoc carneum NIES-2107]|nr:hypothetical protein NIES2107_05650 [Nostoc carneum NIES-2107]